MVIFWEEAGRDTGFVSRAWDLSGARGALAVAAKEDGSIQEKVDLECPCFGCGPKNVSGLGLRSFPDPDGGGLVAVWDAQAQHAGSASVLCGGVIATLIDCHSIWTAVHHTARAGEDPVPHFVTAELRVKYLRPAPLGRPVRLVSRVNREEGRRVHVDVDLFDDKGEMCSTGQVACHRLDHEWGPNPYHAPRAPGTEGKPSQG